MGISAFGTLKPGSWSQNISCSPFFCCVTFLGSTMKVRLDLCYRFGLGFCSLSAANDDDRTFRECLLPLFLLGVFVFLFLKNILGIGYNTSE